MNFSKDAKNFYFKDEKITMKHRHEFVRYKGDVDIIIGTQYIIDRQMENSTSPTYVYRFSHNVQNTVTKIMYNIDMEGKLLIHFSK